MLTEQIWVYFFNRIRGPFSPWEIKLLATKYRDFSIYLGDGRWVAYKEWEGTIGGGTGSPTQAPTHSHTFLVRTKRFIKRRLLRNCH